MAFVLDDILISVALSAISAALSYAAAPKPEDSTMQLNDVPLAQDGQIIKGRVGTGEFETNIRIVWPDIMDLAFILFTYPERD